MHFFKKTLYCLWYTWKAMKEKDKKGCSPCQKIFLGFGGFLAICIAVMGAMTIYTYATQPKPDDIVLQHFEDLKANEISAAYDLTASAFKRNTRLPAFEKFVNSFSVLTTIAEVEILNSKQNGSEAEVSGYITCIHGHHSPFTIRLTTELDEWRIIDIEVDQSEHSDEQSKTK
jgi:hypothetical protein